MQKKIMEIKKLDMKFPPNGLYCPVCNSKAEGVSYNVDELGNKLTMYKSCQNCYASWEVLYNIVPIKIQNLESKIIYEDIPLN